MGRKKIEAQETKSNRGNNLSELSELVEKWGSKKTVLDPLTKEVKSYADSIKLLMLEENLDESISGAYTACLSFQTKEEVNEEGLLAYIKSDLWGDKGSMTCPYIKRVEVIDWDALESAIYNHELTQEQLLAIDEFRTVSKTPVLKLKTRKES